MRKISLSLRLKLIKALFSRWGVLAYYISPIENGKETYCFSIDGLTDTMKPLMEAFLVNVMEKEETTRNVLLNVVREYLDKYQVDQKNFLKHFE